MSKMTAFTMPKWGIEMSEGTISEWNVAEGDSVTTGQVVAQIETDKIVNEVQIEQNTRFVRLVAEVGDAYPVGALLAVTASEAVTGAEIDAFVKAFVPAGGAAGVDVAAVVQEEPMPAQSATMPPTAALARATAPPVAASAAIPTGLKISPAARALALRLVVDVSKIEGRGKEGRITLQDVDQAAKPARSRSAAGAVSIVFTDAVGDSVYASPYAKRLALLHNVDLASVTATGARGRISRQDVAKAAGVSPGLGQQAAVDVTRMSATRKAIARQLTLSKSTIPHFYLRTQANLEALVRLRGELKHAQGSAPSVNDYLIRAAALALATCPDVNIQVHGEEIHRFRNADISVAVATDKGLITPVIRAAQRKSVAQISVEMRQLAEKARAGKLRGEDIEGGSFTLSNLGMFNIDQFDAIINPPQGAILAVGAARRRPVERDGGLFLASTLALSVSCDHRAIDGAVGAVFLDTLTKLIEAPQRL